MKYVLFFSFIFLAFACTGKEENAVATSTTAQEKMAQSPEVLKALGEKDCDEKAKAKQHEANPESIGLNKKSNQGCTLE